MIIIWPYYELTIWTQFSLIPEMWAWTVSVVRIPLSDWNKSRILRRSVDDDHFSKSQRDGGEKNIYNTRQHVFPEFLLSPSSLDAFNMFGYAYVYAMFWQTIYDFGLLKHITKWNERGKRKINRKSWKKNLYEWNAKIPKIKWNKNQAVCCFKWQQQKQHVKEKLIRD